MPKITTGNELKKKVKELKKELSGFRKQEQIREKAARRYHFLYEFSPIAFAESDCTEMKRYIEKLRESGVVNFREYFRKRPETVFECMDKFKVLNVNKAMVVLLEAGNKMRLKGGFGQIFDDESFDSFREGIVAYAEGKPTFEAEVVIKTLKGTIRHVALKWAFVPESEDSRTRMLGAMVDVTGAYQTEEKLAMFQTISDRANVGNAISDLKGNLTYANETFARMHGYNLQEILGKHFSFFHTEEQLKTLDALVKKLRRKQSLDNVEVWHVRKDGSVFPTLSNATVIRDVKSGHVYVSTTTIDISERKEMEKELDSRNRNLEEANIALKVVIENNQKENIRLEDMLRNTIDNVLQPALSNLRKSGLTPKQESSLNFLASSLNKILPRSSANKTSGQYLKLTPAEVQIARFIKDGNPSIEIARMLGISTRTVTVHRNNIRKKFGLSNKKVNLQTYLQSLE